MDTSKLLYTKEHEWVFVEGSIATIGISDHAQEQLGDVVYVELPDVDTEVKQGNELATVESSKAASDIYSPVSGKVTENNADLEASPELLNQDCYGQGWICKVEIAEEPQGLMDAGEYDQYLKGL